MHFCISLSVELSRGGAFSGVGGGGGGGGNKQTARKSQLEYGAVFICVESNLHLLQFRITTKNDWLKKLAPLFHPIRSETKTIRDRVRNRFPALCICH